MSKTVVIFNGAPNSGKDALGEKIASFLNAPVLRFKDGLYGETAKWLKLSFSSFKEQATNRKTKDAPMNGLVESGMTPREALIHVSENIIKPTHGADYFGKLLAAKLQDGFTVVTDSGFVPELLPIVMVADKILIVQLLCEGCSFEGDSRNFLPPIYEENVTQFWFRNYKTSIVEDSARLLRWLTEEGLFDE